MNAFVVPAQSLAPARTGPGTHAKPLDSRLRGNDT
jgi:hypothetical protein